MKTAVFYFFILAFLFLFQPLIAHARISLETPDRVARGDAFIARAVASEPVQEFIFHWRGKKYVAKAVESNGNAWLAEVMLPVPLDEKSSTSRLSISADGAKMEDTGTVISFYDKKRPTQNLTVDKKYVHPPASEKARIERDREKVRQALSGGDNEKRWTVPFYRPVQGTVSSQFGMKRVFNGEPRSVHRGLDLRGAQGTPVYACADGRVALVDDLYYSGNTVYLDHGGGVFSAYLHMSQPKVTPGQFVKRGDLVGLVGSTGRVTGPHLHLSLIVQGQSVDPAPLLEERKKGKSQ